MLEIGTVIKNMKILTRKRNRKLDKQIEAPIVEYQKIETPIVEYQKFENK